jgi:hypothetical protein
MYVHTYRPVIVSIGSNDALSAMPWEQAHTEEELEDPNYVWMCFGYGVKGMLQGDPNK